MATAPAEVARPAERGLSRLLTLVVPLAALWLVVRQFAIESQAFSNLLLLTVAGVAAHGLMPSRWRLPFFAVLSLAAIVLVLGAGPAAWLIGLGCLLIALFHLPGPFAIRVGLVLAAGGALAVMRIGWTSIPVPSPVWPLLGSMFMFRLASYVYDVRHDPRLAGFWPALSYFFLLPNVCFPLFPVVDYKTFRRTCDGSADPGVGHEGLRWIARGVAHLLLYRVVYQTLVIDASQVVTASDFAQYLVWPFLLYLRVSGQFHIIVGMLRLFGFNLPETHHAYFLASSFTDFWRRINIYWKDFMMKLFYYPSFFALRRRGEVFGLVVSTLIVFTATWALHSYQWFWLRGSVLFAWNDVLFWAVLGVLVVVNALYEWRHGRSRAIVPRALSWRETLGLTGRTVAMFCAISIIWSLWSSESLGTWLALWPALLNWSGPPTAPALTAMAVPVAVGVATIVKARGWSSGLRPSVHVESALVTAAAALLVVTSSVRLAPHLGAVGTAMVGLRRAGLNQADALALERGYYENLMGVDRFNGELWALYTNRPVDWERTLIESGLARPTSGADEYELLPSASGRFKGANLETNRWGMHDQEYEQTPRPGCSRLALLGASHAMGSGVPRAETFEARLEARLRAARPDRCVEILNFAVYGYNPISQLPLLDERVLRFAPTTILYVGHPEDSQRVARRLAQLVRSGAPLPGAYLEAIVRDAGVTADLTERIAIQRLMPFGPRVLSELYAQLVGRASAHHACAGFVYLPMVPDMSYATDVEREKELARDAGFTLLDLTGVYDVPDRERLWLAPWDAHPNATGHALVAARLDELLEANPTLLTCQARPLAGE